MKKILLASTLLLVISTTLYAAGSDNFRLSETKTTPIMLKFIDEYYIDQARINPFEMLKGGLKQVEKLLPEFLATFEGGDNFTITVDQATKKFSSKNISTLTKLWNLLKDVYTFIEIHYHGTIDQHDIEYTAIDGMLGKLDPHSNILPPKIFDEFKIGTKGKFGGIGIVIGMKEGELTVISPIEDTPAWRAGIRASDNIIQIGEESTVNMTLTEAVELLRGDVGTKVIVTIERAGRPNPFNVTLKRAIINIESVQSTTISSAGRAIGYIKVKSFQEDTDKEFTRQLNKLKTSPNFAGLIIDLRNNPGGLLSQAVAMADKFISDGVIVSTIGAGDRFLEQETAKSAGTELPYPVIILVNEGSASASEIVSGTLQSYKRAIVMGSQTFGKGSVQTVYDLKDGSALKLTIAEYLTAGKNSIQTIGVTPDIKLIPATIDKEMDMAENEHESETSLEGHLAHASDIAKSEPSFKLSYLQPAESDNEEENSRREYTNKLDFSKDPIVGFAAKIAANISVVDNEIDFKSAAASISEIDREQQKLISSSLAKLGLNWSDCSSDSGKPVLQVSFTMKKNGEVVKQASSGDEIDISLNAKNIGTGSFCKLIGISHAKESFLKNKEFVIGRLTPSESRSWSAHVKIPKYLSGQNIPMTVKFNEAGSNQPAEFKAIIPVRALPRPQYAYSFKFGTPLNTKVAGVAIPVGKFIPLIVEIKNTGGGVSPNVVATIKNEADTKGVFIDIGRIKIGRMEPGQTTKAIFKFRIEPALSKSTFNLEMAIMDADLLTELEKKIEVNVAGGTTEPAAGQWFEGPHITLKNLTAPAGTSSASYHIEGELTDDQEIKDYFIFVGDEKVVYSSNSQQTGSYHLSANLPLKDGNNFVSIIARDNQDMMTRYNFVVDKK